jgi:hypothetical protein
MNKLVIVGAIASNSGEVTLYLKSGETRQLSSENWKTKQIMKDIVRPLSLRQEISIDLEDYSPFKALEKKSGGFIKFVTSKVKGLFGGVETETETVTGIYGDTKIPNFEKLEGQVRYSSENRDFRGFQIFMERISKMIESRGHTVSELLEFMKKGDLPIADDGSIVGYKVLTETDTESVWVDNHTRSVQQRVGSLVSMPVQDVDESRRVECSTGLHIARRGYISSYGGSIVTLVKINPEDVVCVPANEPNKMRVCAYHIVARIPPAGVALVRSNRAMTTDPACATILAKVLSGDHVSVLEKVEVSAKKSEDRRKPEKITSTPVENKLDPELLASAISGDLSAALKVSSAIDDFKTWSPEIAEMNKEARALSPAKASVDPKPVRSRAKKKKAEASQDASMRREAKHLAAISKEVSVKPVKPAKPSANDTEASRRRSKAIAAAQSGMSMRQAAKEFGVCAKWLSKEMKKPKPD